MISIKTDNAADVILDILRRSQAVRTNIQNKESTKALDTGEICTDFSYSPGPP